MILEKEYVYCYWLECQIDKPTFESFIQNLDQVNETHKVKLIDGVDEESQSICFKFNQVKPTKTQEIKWAKTKNEQNCKRFLYALSKKLDGRLYFNVSKKIIKQK